MDGMRPVGKRREEPILWVGVRGGLAGAITCCTTHPLSLLKAYSQFGSNRSFFGAVKAVLRDRKVLSDSPGKLMVGSRLRCTHAAPFLGILFGTYQAMSRELCTHPTASVPLAKAFMAGAASGVVASAVMFPIDTLNTRKVYLDIKTKMPLTRYSIVGMLTNLLKEQGVRGVYLGLGACVIESIPAYGFTFMIFEFTERSWGKPRSQLSFVEHFVSGSVAAGFAQSLAFPFESIRKMVQTGYVPVGSAGLVRKVSGQTWLSVCRAIIQANGIMGAWKGSRAHLLAHIPYWGLVFALYECISFDSWRIGRGGGVVHQ